MTHLRPKPFRWGQTQHIRHFTVVLLFCFIQSVASSLDYSGNSTQVTKLSEPKPQGTQQEAANQLATQGSAGLVMSNDFAFAILQEIQRQADQIQQLQEKDVQRDREMLDLHERLEEQRQLAVEADRKLKYVKEELLNANAEERKQRELDREQAEKERSEQNEKLKQLEAEYQAQQHRQAKLSQDYQASLVAERQRTDLAIQQKQQQDTSGFIAAAALILFLGLGPAGLFFV